MVIYSNAKKHINYEHEDNEQCGQRCTSDNDEKQKKKNKSQWGETPIKRVSKKENGITNSIDNSEEMFTMYDKLLQKENTERFLSFSVNVS